MLSENVDKCTKCKYAFACDEQDEFNCKQKDYNRFELDSHYIETLGPGNEKYYYRRKVTKAKFEDLPTKEEYIKIEDIKEHAKEFKTYFDLESRPVIDAFVYSLNNLPKKEI